MYFLRALFAKSCTGSSSFVSVSAGTNTNFYSAGGVYAQGNNTGALVYGSGRFDSNTTSFAWRVEGYGTCSLSLDNIVLYTYPWTIGTNPLPGVSTPLIVNGAYSMTQNSQASYAFDQGSLVATQPFTMMANFDATISSGYYCDLSIYIWTGSNFNSRDRPAVQRLASSGSSSLNISALVSTAVTTAVDTLHFEMGCLGSGNSVRIMNFNLTANPS